MGGASLTEKKCCPLRTVLPIASVQTQPCSQPGLALFLLARALVQAQPCSLLCTLTPALTPSLNRRAHIKPTSATVSWSCKNSISPTIAPAPNSHTSIFCMSASRPTTLTTPSMITYLRVEGASSCGCSMSRMDCVRTGGGGVVGLAFVLGRLAGGNGRGSSGSGSGSTMCGGLGTVVIGMVWRLRDGTEYNWPNSQ